MEDDDQQQQQRRRKMEEDLRTSPNCPRCSSRIAKFGYYNNCNITQPRYLCRTCHQYWTNGGIIRGTQGGCCSKRSKTKALPSASRCAGDPDYLALPSASRCAGDPDYGAYAYAPLRAALLTTSTRGELEAIPPNSLVHGMIGSLEANANAPPPAPGSQPPPHYYGLTIEELMREPEFMASINPDLQGTPAQQQNDAPPLTETYAAGVLTDDVPPTAAAADVASTSGVSKIKEEEEEEEEEVMVKTSSPK